MILDPIHAFVRFVTAAAIAWSVAAMTGCSSATTVGDGGDGGDATDTATLACGAVAPGSVTFDRSCTADTDCAVVAHQTDCCGTIWLLGIRASQSSQFASDESTCEASYPRCGCASSGVFADNGVTVGTDPTDRGGVVPQCLAGTCRALVPPVACDTMTCAPGQVCVHGCVGDAGAGGPPPGSCVTVPAACGTAGAPPSCDCLGAAGCGVGGMCNGASGRGSLTTDVQCGGCA